MDPGQCRGLVGAEEKPVRIGFDVSQTGTGKAGCGYAADSLIRELAAIDETNEYVLYPTFGDAYLDPEGPEATLRIDHPNFSVGPVSRSQRQARELWRHPGEDFEKKLGAPDVIHSFNFFCPVGLKHARLIYTLHDLAFLRHPEWTTEHNRQLCFEGVFDAALHADFVLAVSEHSRRHFLDIFPHYPEERTGVVYWASRFQDSDSVPVERPPSLSGLEDDGFLLFVGTLEPRKNPLRLLRSYARYAEAAAEPLPLTLAGGNGWLLDDFDHLVESSGISHLVRRLGYVDDRELRWLYRNCRAFLYPSLFEGFGLPVVEAASQGAAVVTSIASSLPEVIGDDGALLIDPTDEDELTRAIETVAGDPEVCSRLREQAPAAAARFSWRRAAEEVLAIYEQTTATEEYRGAGEILFKP